MFHGLKAIAAISVLLAGAATVSADEPLVMVKYAIKDVDRNQNQLLATLLVPKGWKTEHKIVWDLHSNVYPFTLWQRYSAPDNSIVVETLSDVGRVLSNEACPKDVLEGLMQVAQMMRPDARNVKMLNSKSTKWMPEGPGMLQYGTVVFSYTLGKREVEEEFTGNLFINTANVGNMALKLGYLGGIRATSADKGKLEQARAIGIAMERSAQPSPEFMKAIVVAGESVQTVQQNHIQQTLADGQFFQMINKQINDTWKRTCEEKWVATDRRMEQFRDVLGGVNRFSSTKSSSEVLLPHTHKHAWEGPNNTYILTNDPSYRPDADFKGQWDRLKPKN